MAENASPLVVLACRVFEQELGLLTGAMQAPVHIHYLEQGLHDTPEILRAELQKAINTLEQEHPGTDTILCAYGLCGQSFAGVHTRRTTLVLPNAHDCIPLLLGLNQQQTSDLEGYATTYWLSPGWLEHSQMPFIKERPERRAAYVKKFGEKSADYLMQTEASWRAHYKRTCYIRWQDMDEHFIADAHFVAEDAELPYAEQPGKPDYLAALLAGGKDAELFVHIPPGYTVMVGEQGNLAVVPLVQK